MNLTAEVVKSRIYRARQKFRRIYDGTVRKNAGTSHAGIEKESPSEA